MTDEKRYNLKELFEEIKASGGLPDNLTTEAQLWDEIMKKEAFLMPEQLFPLIKEVHGKVYDKGTEIYPLATEFSVDRIKEGTPQIASIRADITVIVAKKDIYHFECQIDNDGTMVIRMFEYDVNIALNYITETEDGMELRFPHSAVLFLQDNGNIPDELVCKIKFQDGGIYQYRVPTIKVQTYTLEEIKEKHLCVLIPFLPLRFQKNMKAIQKQKEDIKRNKLVTKQKVELSSLYEQIMLLLEEEVANGYLSETNRKTIISLLGKSMIRVFYRNEELLREVITMTEPILELEFEKVERYKRELKKLAEEYKKELETQSAEYEKALESQSTEYEKALESQSAEYEKALESQSKQHEKEIAELKKQIEELKQKQN